MRFQFYRQNNSMSCGVACLQMICKYYGRKYDQKSLEDLCIPTTEGVSLLSISRTAEHLGFKTKLCRLTTEQLKCSQFPSVLFWNQNHFVVLYKIKKDKTFCVADPGKGLLQYSHSEFEKYWISLESEGVKKGVAMLLEPSTRFKEIKNGTAINSKHNMKAFSFLFYYIKQYRKYFSLILLGLSLGCLLQIIMPFLTQSIVDIGIKNGSSLI